MFFFVFIVFNIYFTEIILTNANNHHEDIFTFRNQINNNHDKQLFKKYFPDFLSKEIKKRSLYMCPKPVEHRFAVFFKH